MAWAQILCSASVVLGEASNSCQIFALVLPIGPDHLFEESVVSFDSDTPESGD